MIKLSPKKFIVIVAVLLLVVFGIVAYFWLKDYFRQQVEIEKEGVEQVAVSEPKSAVEGEIEATKKQLEELSKLPPEEIKKREEARQVLSQQKVSEDIKIAGVSVTVGDDRKIVKNSDHGYSIEVPQNLVIARTIKSDWLEFHDKEFMCEGDPECEPVLRISAVENNPAGLAIGEWLEREEKAAGSKIYSPREKIVIGGETVYKVTEEIPARFEGYYYYWSRGTKIYYLRISVFDEEKYRKFIETFRFE